MAKRETFEAGGLKITTWRELNGRSFVVWRPNVSMYCQTSREVLQFAAWPAKTPTGDALREWLASLGAADQQKEKPAILEQEHALLKETGFDPIHHSDESDPQFQTRTII